MTFGSYKPDSYINCPSFGEYNSKYSIKILAPHTGFQNSEYRKFKRDDYVYYALPHKSEYKVKMCNNGDLRVDAVLKIDGTKMGTWRIDPYSCATIERPSHNNRKFTFVQEGSWQGNMGGVAQGNPDNGLVEVTFIPEYTYDSFPMTNNMSFNSVSRSRQFMNNSYSTGGTVLGDGSSQTFTDASHLSLNYSKKVTKRVRLVVEENRKLYVPLGTRGYTYDDVHDDPVPPRLNHAYHDSKDDYEGSFSSPLLRNYQ